MRKRRDIFVMQKLKSLENRFILSPLKVKFELYFLVVLLSYFFIYFYSFEEFNLNENYNDFKSKKMNQSFISIIKDYENFLKKQNIKTPIYKVKNKNLNISFISSNKKILKVLSFIENYNEFSNIKHFDLIKIKNDYQVNINISFKKYYIKNFVKNNKNRKNKSEKLKLKAIIANYVLINSKILKKGDYINSYEIKQIYSNEVVLKKENKTIYLKVYNDKKQK